MTKQTKTKEPLKGGFTLRKTIILSSVNLSKNNFVFPDGITTIIKQRNLLSVTYKRGCLSLSRTDRVRGRGVPKLSPINSRRNKKYPRRTK